MATAAQANANRENAKSSTGPRTSEGKQTASNNATKFGLFSLSNCVHVEEREEYDLLCEGLFGELAPVGHIEGMLATEVVRCAWRLRRCAHAEQNLSGWTRKRENKRNAPGEPDKKPADPVVYEYSAPAQAAIDRARSSAQNGVRRAMADLANHQTERLLRERLLPAETDPSTLGLARVTDLIAVADNNAKAQHRAAQAESSAFVDNLFRQFQEDDARIADYLNKSRQPGAASQPAPTAITERTQSPSQSPAVNNEITQSKTDRSGIIPSNGPSQTEATGRQSKTDRSGLIPSTGLSETETEASGRRSEASPTPRNSQCRCGSGLKFKRCCGINAPAVLQVAA